MTEYSKYDPHKFDYLHEEEFWSDDEWKLDNECTCFACRFIRREADDEELREYRVTIDDFETRLKALRTWFSV